MEERQKTSRCRLRSHSAQYISWTSALLHLWPCRHTAGDDNSGECGQISNGDVHETRQQAHSSAALGADVSVSCLAVVLNRLHVRFENVFQRKPLCAYAAL